MSINFGCHCLATSLLNNIQTAQKFQKTNPIVDGFVNKKQLAKHFPMGYNSAV